MVWCSVLRAQCDITGGHDQQVSSHDAPHLQRVPDRQQSVLSVCPSSLAGGAQVVIRTNRTLEASSHHGALTAVTGDVGVQGGGRGHVKGRGMRSSRWRRRRRVPEGEWREGVKRKVSAVLLLLWKSSIKLLETKSCINYRSEQMNLFTETHAKIPTALICPNLIFTIKLFPASFTLFLYHWWRSGDVVCLYLWWRRGRWRPSCRPDPSSVHHQRKTPPGLHLHLKHHHHQTNMGRCCIRSNNMNLSLFHLVLFCV